ncbi:MAG: Cof-type HAD-IIB family hydrolase [Sporolactobacillus sp.]|uniref:Cof-type HAD-IIB family hydrolase n=1 Tax=Sporolactobacillus sp. STSJ-5 TaxID=2965076 RepID=UPI002107C1A3|nr:Cof-type HAD-IIB family hydrolase [Sporolactobacillus sp. STSJ-5]MCQ2008771.1 Cof-type HAD-IIB family hydrolase [Sporolactobacillus sp. STSJ-5]
MPIQLIFSDIDGTLINSEHVITKKTVQAIKQCASQDIPFILISARMPSGIIPLQRQLGSLDPIICYSGALIVDQNDTSSEPLLSVTMNPQSVQFVYQQICNRFPKISFSAYSFNRWLVPEKTDAWIAQEEAIARTPSSTYAFQDQVPESLPPIHKLLCMGDPEDIDQLQTVLSEATIDAVFYKSKPTYLEIMAKDVSKANAMREIMIRYHIAQEHTLAFGDNFNDVPMLRFAGIGVAMGNAPEQVKGSADFVTLSNDQDGIKAALERLGVLTLNY